MSQREKMNAARNGKESGGRMHVLNPQPSQECGALTANVTHQGHYFDAHLDKVDKVSAIGWMPLEPGRKVHHVLQGRTQGRTGPQTHSADGYAPPLGQTLNR
jgi:hypothetical protein